ncbi:protein piccolo [Caerostris darwini]|uniref:Protein piccolo n=1 Tax=Caerostris darwini TaxID=1538125 RepID=A0AAV4WDG4_9ARAC|nr:protein piccolo [Caerostris darwini]
MNHCFPFANSYGCIETVSGDQVLEWNGVPLTGKTYEEVQRIIASSGDEVEIVIRSDFNMLGSRHSSSHHPHHPHQPQNRRNGGGERHGGRNYNHPHQSGGYRSSRSDGYGRNYDNEDYYQPPVDEGVSSYADERGGSSSPSRGYQGSGRRQQRIVSPIAEKGDSADNKVKYRAEDISGEIQLQVCHDSKAGILYVTIVRARNLVTSRDNSGLPDPYVMCYLLPDRWCNNLHVFKFPSWGPANAPDIRTPTLDGADVKQALQNTNSKRIVLNEIWSIVEESNH